MDEITSYALLVGTVVDPLASPASIGSRVTVRDVAVGTPPVSTAAVWARVYADDAFVIAADASGPALDDPSSVGPSPKHLAGVFDLHFVIEAAGYDARAVIVPCNHDAIPIRPAAYVLDAEPIAIRGRVTALTGLTTVPVAGATMSLTASLPTAALPPPALTEADGTYSFTIVPPTRSLSMTASGGGLSASKTVDSAGIGPVLTVNFTVA